MLIAHSSYTSLHWKVVSETEINLREEINTRKLNVTVKSCAEKEDVTEWVWFYTTSITEGGRGRQMPISSGKPGLQSEFHVSHSYIVCF